MNIKVNRQACCSQDDQVGPLEAEYQVEAETLFSTLIQQIVKSGFLQFTSTHNRMTGEVNGKAVVEVFSTYGGVARQPEYIENPSDPISEVLGGRPLSFYFRHV